MRLVNRIRTDFDQVKYHYGQGNDQGLAHFQAVDTGQNVNGICAENCQRRHEHVVK